MTDIIDQGCEMEEKQRELSLKFRRSILKACGTCYNCGELLTNGGIFCHTVDNGCRIDYEARESARVRNGT